MEIGGIKNPPKVSRQLKLEGNICSWSFGNARGSRNIIAKNTPGTKSYHPTTISRVHEGVWGTRQGQEFGGRGGLRGKGGMGRD